MPVLTAAIQDIPSLIVLINNAYRGNEDGEIKGTVFLRKAGKKLYFGMLSVSPLLQDKGIGKQLMTCAETYAKENSCHSIFMRVISVRHELIAWYERKGYSKTGETEAFPQNNQFGIPTQPLEFLVMEKQF